MKGRQRKLPEKGTVEEKELIKEYPTADREQIKSWSKRFGFNKISNFQSSVYHVLGLRRRPGNRKRRNNEKIEKEQIIVNLPPVKLLVFVPKREDVEDEETAILHYSDGHAGKITKSFNKNVYRTRMETSFNSAMRIVDLHRHMYPIKKLVIINTGDNVQGENPHQGSKIGETEMGARDQVKKLAAPMWNDLIGSFKQHYEVVEFHGFPGNHGAEKLAPETSNYDLLLYDILEFGIGREKGIKINIYESFSDIINIEGFRCFCFHGDGIPCQAGVPFFALDKKLKSWYMQYGGFNYAFGGHFHKRHTDEIGSKLEYFMCSTLVSDDEWVLKKLGISSNPSQWIYGIHYKNGLTWRYPLIVDYEFLPEKLNGY